LVLSPTSDKSKIKDALENLQAGGSTAGGEGIKLAYKIAAENLIKGGNNRVVLASDGDFNVGVSSEAELKNLIEEKRNSGVFLSVLGFGMGNYKDNKMETLADKGNGNYAYIDNLQEAQKVFVHEFGGTMFTVAKDVKLQLEFNPKFVKAYRLIGYENRMLRNEDFNDDKKDAGEMGSGHTVTALYEIVPVGVESAYLKNIDELKYQTENGLSVAAKSNEVLTVKLRYKSPDENKSKLMEKVITDQQTSFDKTSENFRFAVAVAEFGLILRQSEFRGMANYEQVIDLAKNAKGSDEEGYRAEFIKLVKTAKMLDKTVVASNKD
jgi:Ca-activated chloride channel homolog